LLKTYVFQKLFLENVAFSLYARERHHVLEGAFFILTGTNDRYRYNLRIDFDLSIDALRFYKTAGCFQSSQKPLFLNHSKGAKDMKVDYLFVQYQQERNGVGYRYFADETEEGVTVRTYYNILPVLQHYGKEGWHFSGWDNGRLLFKRKVPTNAPHESDSTQLPLVDYLFVKYVQEQGGYRFYEKQEDEGIVLQNYKKILPVLTHYGEEGWSFICWDHGRLLFSREQVS